MSYSTARVAANNIPSGVGFLPFSGRHPVLGCVCVEVMIFILPVVAVAVAFALVRGGSLDALARTQFRWLSVLFGALVVQAAFDIWDPSWLDDTGDVVILVGSNVAVAVFLAVNWSLPGMPVASAGMLLNAIVISANGAMPVSSRSAQIAGHEGPLTDAGFKHELLGPDTLLPWLGDVIPIPVLQTVISVGDVLLALGIGWLVFRRMTSRR